MSASATLPNPVRLRTVARWERTVLSDVVSFPPDESAYALKIVGVYQDSITREWARQMCHPVTQGIGDEWVLNTWYQVNDLGDTGILLDAVHAALRADVIVVSVHAADELPVELCTWFDVWLPRRPPRVSVLAAVIGVAGQPGSQAERTQEYLQAVARRGQLDFVPHKRTLPTDDAARFL
jgi:hypothetical protein